MKKTPKIFYHDLVRSLQEHRQAETQSMDICETIRRLRVSRAMSGAELCRKAGDLDPRTLTAVEKGRIRNPSMRTLQSVARGLEVTVSDLFRQAEVPMKSHFFTGNQKGAYQAEFPQWGIKVVSFTPLLPNFFAGKFIFGNRKVMGRDHFPHPHPIYMSVLVGRFEADVEGRKVALKEGENLFFHGGFEFTVANALQRESVLFLMTAPSLI